MGGGANGKRLSASVVEVDNFEPQQHFYPRALNSSPHPLVKMFMSLSHERMAKRYVHLHPNVNVEKLLEVFKYGPKYFPWAGADLFCVTNKTAHRHMIVIETNSCPSGQKSTPFDNDDATSYHSIVKHSIAPKIRDNTNKEDGALAVIYDKNPMETTGYAAVIADEMKESVYLAEFYEDDPDPPVKYEADGYCYVRDKHDVWHKCRAAFRYVTQKPWNRIPIESKTILFNPIIACLAGGRNKLVASKAYEFLNLEMAPYGLKIRYPETITDVSFNEIPLYVKSMGMKAVVKIPYSNAGQGVFTITSAEELEIFMNENQHYDKYIVQALVGNSEWSSNTVTGTYYHIGTVPNRKNATYVYDLRMMISGSQTDGYRPIAIYSRKAAKPLKDTLSGNEDSWEMLGTNLSIKLEEGGWSSDTNRLLLMDTKDFNQLGVGLDDLIDGYVQTVLGAMAIDRLCRKMMVGGTYNIVFLA